MRQPGNEGLTVQRVGDANPWVKPDESQESQGSTIETTVVPKADAVGQA